MKVKIYHLCKLKLLMEKLFVQLKKDWNNTPKVLKQKFLEFGVGGIIDSIL